MPERTEHCTSAKRSHANRCALNHSPNQRFTEDYTSALALGTFAFARAMARLTMGTADQTRRGPTRRDEAPALMQTSGTGLSSRRGTPRLRSTSVKQGGEAWPVRADVL